MNIKNFFSLSSTYPIIISRGQMPYRLDSVIVRPAITICQGTSAPPAHCRPRRSLRHRSCSSLCPESHLVTIRPRLLGVVSIYRQVFRPISEHLHWLQQTCFVSLHLKTGLVSPWSKPCLLIDASTLCHICPPIDTQELDIALLVSNCDMSMPSI